MRPHRIPALLLPVLLAGWLPAQACNPAPPRPAILEGYRYDAMAARALLRDADAVVSARLKLRIDTLLGPGDAPDEAGYVFEVIEGWKAVLPQRLTLAGVWVDCALPLQAGQVFLLYLSGERLLHAVPAETLDFELDLLGGPAWFYDAAGRLVTDEAD